MLYCHFIGGPLDANLPLDTLDFGLGATRII